MTDHSDQRVDDTVARIALRERLLAIVVDDHRRIFNDFPRHLYADRERETQRERHAGKEKPQREIEQEAVDDMAEPVPIGEVLGVPGAEHHAFPELDGATLRNRRLAEQK